MIEKLNLNFGEGGSDSSNIVEIEDKINKIIDMLNNDDDNVVFKPKFKKGDTIRCIKVPRYEDKHNSFIAWIDNFKILLCEEVVIQNDSNLSCNTKDNPKYETVFIHGVQVDIKCFELVK